MKRLFCPTIWFLPVLLFGLFAELCASLPASMAYAQGRPDLVWMRGGNLIGDTKAA